MGIQLLSFSAVAVMALALWRSGQLLKRLKPSRHRRGWLVMRLLMAGFLVAYAVFFLRTLRMDHASWEWLTASVFLFGAGFVVAVIELAILTARELGQAQLEGRDLERLLATAFDGVLRLGSDGSILQASEGCPALLGSPDLAGLQGKKLSDLFPAEVRNAVGRHLLQADGQLLRAQTRAEGQLLELGLHVVPLDSPTSSLLVAMRDMSRGNRLQRERDQFFGLSVDLLCVADFEGYFKQVNQAWTRALGYTTQELMACPYHEFIHPDDRDTSVLSANWTTSPGPPLVRFENRFRHKLGHYRWLRWSACVSLEDQRVYAVARDDTESQRAELRFRQVVEVSPSGILLVDAQNRIVLVNSQLEKLLRYSRVELAEKPLESVLPHFTERCTELRERLFAPGNQTAARETCELVARRKDGSELPIVATFSPLETEEGPCLLVSVEDLSEQRRAHEQLARQIAILEATTDLVASASPEGELRYVNRAGRELLGLHDDDSIGGMRLNDLHPEWARRRLEKEILPEVYARGSSRGELALLSRNGEEVPVSVVYVVHRVRGERHLSTIMRDISEHKKAEAALAEARDAAVASSHAKAQFLANMSHEIRTPLNAITGMSNLILDTRLNAEQEEFASTIRDSAQVLLDLINEVLDFSKLEARRVELEEIEFQVRPVIDEALQLCASRALAKNLELLALIPPGVPGTVRGDPSRLRQVLLNLLSNAIKFTEKGEVRVEVQNNAANVAVVELEFNVIDSGVGIPAEAQRRIFRPFGQADASTTRRYGGSGLGLVICKRLVELMGGSIGFDSRVGAGTRFWFRLPFARPARGSQVQTGPTAVLKARVLIVDDHARSRQMLSYQLGWLGVRCVQASTAPEAIERLQAAGERDPFQAVLIARKLGEVDGLDLAGRIAELEQPPALRILLSRLDLKLDREQLSAQGITGVLRKPVRHAELRECLERGLGAHEVPDRHSSERHTLRRRSIRILLAEDNSVNRKIALLQLKKLGYNADTVANGAEAVETLQSLPYDLVLMDCQMPVLDGYDATHKIRQLNIPRVPIVAMTAFALSGDREKCLAAGMDDYIAKPIEIQTLKATLQRWCAPVEQVALDQLSQLADDDPGLFPELISQYLSDAAERIEALNRLLKSEEEETQALHHAAHQLKGSSAQIGARFLSVVCKKLEDAASSGQIERCRELSVDLANEWDYVRSALQEVLRVEAQRS